MSHQTPGHINGFSEFYFVGKFNFPLNPFMDDDFPFITSVPNDEFIGGGGGRGGISKNIAKTEVTFSIFYFYARQ